jgi:hypothetical protein
LAGIGGDWSHFHSPWAYLAGIGGDWSHFHSSWAYLAAIALPYELHRSGALTRGGTAGSIVRQPKNGRDGDSAAAERLFSEPGRWKRAEITAVSDPSRAGGAKRRTVASWVTPPGYATR